MGLFFVSGALRALDRVRDGRLTSGSLESGSTFTRSGEPFLIGVASSFSPPASGWLYLTVNDNLGFYLDNLAGFTVLFSGK